MSKHVSSRINVSHLSSEKQAFLEDNLEFLKSLEQQIPIQVNIIQKYEMKMKKTKAKWQRDLDEAITKAKIDELRIYNNNQYLREIEEKFCSKKTNGVGKDK